MLKTVLILPDGTQLTSGTEDAVNILSASLVQSVNEGQELTLGAACASRLEVKLRAPEGAISPEAGQEVQLYKQDAGGERHLLGLYTLEKPVRVSANTLQLTAYDRMTRLDRELASWLCGLDGWPYSLYALAVMVCDACGLELANETLPNGDHPVAAFAAASVTGRTLVKWIGQACGCFCRVTPEGKAEFAWYTPCDAHITPDGTLFYYQNGLTYADYAVQPVEKVQIHQSREDVGVVWPDETGEKNTYILTGNMLLTGEDSQSLLPVAQSLYTQLQDVSYTPCKVTIPHTLSIVPGSIVTVTDRGGRTVTVYVMTSTLSGGRQTLECTGSRRRDSTTAVNGQSYQALSGKMLELRTDVEGIRAENKDTTGRVSLLQQTVDGITTRVSDQQGQLTQIRQEAESIALRVGKVESGGVSQVVGLGYSFTGDGLVIEKDSQTVKTRIDNKGMEVSAYDAPVLTADQRGVEAVDVTVKNYLQIAHSRFEDYTAGADSERTACYWI